MNTKEMREKAKNFSKNKSIPYPLIELILESASEIERLRNEIQVSRSKI